MTGKWIWINRGNEKNEYAEFVTTFKCKKGENTTLKIACDGIYSVFLNEELVAFSGCADYPHYKFYDEVDITDKCEDVNGVKIMVWHLGDNSQTYIEDDPGVIFEVCCGAEVAVYSDKRIKSRKMTEYKNGEIRKITSQLGYTFSYDNGATLNGYGESVEVEKTLNLHKRQIKPLELKDRVEITVLKLENSYLIDMGRETAGFIDLDIDSPIDQLITISYGEHIVDGGVRRIIGDRDFSFDFRAVKGENKYTNTLRRIAGRYLQVYCESPVKINYLGLRPVCYPVEEREKGFKSADEIVNRIYDVCADTLKLCMHEHYEDCPWREQALYTMDSRNQMLCGYYAFKTTEYQRANLVLISKGVRPDGLLSLCFPTGNDFPIPSFSLYNLIQVYEYVEFTKDRSLLAEVESSIKRYIGVFIEHIDDNGLIADFPAPFWNFYEWMEYSDNADQIGDNGGRGKKRYSLILNCLFVYVMRLYKKLFGEADFNEEKTLSAIDRTFRSGDKFRLYDDLDRYSQLGNALAILAGLGNEKTAEEIVGGKMISATLSMRAFVYDALLSFGDKYSDYIIKDIKERYTAMLDAGATSFWETEKGEADFGGAGSLCHGWSAIPVYYFNKLLK
ncbi:MAG: hypothetical protein IJ800_06490 [Clostridia bacterium]|nr:hypothetical protein [Clostridia bacterium]